MTGAGFPIRTSTDPSLVGSSPWLLAATHVLLRLQAPRHPPLALRSLENKRCSCSLWSSQGAESSEDPALNERGRLRFGERTPSKRNRERVRRRSCDGRGAEASTRPPPGRRRVTSASTR